MTRFAANTAYATRSICDHECIFRYLVRRRTAKSVWVSQINNGNVSEKIERKAVKASGDCERVSLGSYSMAPMLSADRLSENVN